MKWEGEGESAVRKYNQWDKEEARSKKKKGEGKEKGEQVNKVRKRQGESEKA